jgi:hypothetical protein
MDHKGFLDNRRDSIQRVGRYRSKWKGLNECDGETPGCEGGEAFQALSWRGLALLCSEVIAGDSNGALGTGAVSLDAGSGLETFHTQTTSVIFNLFGLF